MLLNDLFADPRSDAIDALHAATAIYTAHGVVDALFQRMGWPSAFRTLLDPAAGDGAFLVRALAHLKPAPGDRAAALRVRGYEIHPSAVAEARENVATQLRSHGWDAAEAGAVAHMMLTEGDFLLDAPPEETYDAIVMNPPYLRQAGWPEWFKPRYLATLPAHAQADLMHAFIDRVSGLIARCGTVAMVTADRWLFNAQAATLRERLGERLGIAHIERLDAATAFYRPKRRVKGSPPRVHPVAVILTARERAPIALTRAPISPDRPHGTTADTLTLAQVAEVRLAPWLGPPGSFVVDRATAERLGMEHCVPAVDTDDIDPATDTLRAPTRYAIRTSRDTTPSRAILDHLRPFEAALRKRNPVTWWVPPEAFTHLDLSHERLLIPRIARRLRVVRLPAGVLAVNHNLTVVSTGTWSLDQVRDALLSEAAQAWMSAHSGRLENDYLSILTTVLRRLPVSAPDAEAAVRAEIEGSTDDIACAAA